MDMHIWMGNEREHVCDTLLLWLWFGGEGNGMKYEFNLVIWIDGNDRKSLELLQLFVGCSEKEIQFSIVDDDDCDSD